MGPLRKVLAARAIQGSNSIEGFDVSVEDAVAAINGEEPMGEADEISFHALVREGILVPELCSIEEYLGRNTRPYYDILSEVGRGRWSPERDARPWVRFCIEAHYVQAASVLRRTRESERLWAFLEELLDAAGIPDRLIEALFDASLGMRVRNSSYRASVAQNWSGISNQTATNDLRQAVTAGLLTKHGVKRGTYYRASSRIEEFRARLRSERSPIRTDDLFDPLRGSQTSLFS